MIIICWRYHDYDDDEDMNVEENMDNSDGYKNNNCSKLMMIILIYIANKIYDDGRVDDNKNNNDYTFDYENDNSGDNVDNDNRYSSNRYFWW